MSPLSKYQRPRTTSKIRKKDSTIKIKLLRLKYRNPTQRLGKEIPVKHTASIFGLNSKWQKSVKQKEWIPAKVLCKRFSFSFPY